VLPASLSHYHLSLFASHGNNNNRETLAAVTWCGENDRQSTAWWSVINCVSRNRRQNTHRLFMDHKNNLVHLRAVLGAKSERVE